jgi:NADPH:quinone reductase-like Zn-dependent oxidoreductase
MDGRRIMLRKNGRPEVLQLEAFAPEPPAAGEVQVEVAFAGINFADLVMRIGFYRDAPPLPFVPGYEISGKVGAIGEGVKGIKKGARVASSTRFGGYSSHVNIDASGIFALPPSISLEEAAAFPVQYMTAWAALHESARVRRGEKVLVHGGAGGVGLAAIAIAADAGCEVTATAGGPEKARYITENTPAQGIDYRASPWLEQVGENTMDVVLDPIGGKHLKESIRCIKTGGRVIAYGGADATSEKANLLRGAKMLRAMKFSAIPMLMHSKALMGLNLLRLWDAGVDLRPAAEKLMTSMVAGSIPKPRVDSVFPMEAAAAAHQYLHDRKNIGKVLLSF